MEKTHFTSDPPQRIGQRIRNERSKWNLTQEQLSEHLGISTNYLGQIERGRSFSHALAERFCEFFHITYDYLYYGTEPSKEYTPSETDGELDVYKRQQHHRVVVGPLVSHDAHGAHVGQGRKILAKALVHTCLGDLLPVDGVRLLDNPHFLRSNLTYNPDAQPRARERLPEHQMLWNAQLQASLPHLCLLYTSIPVA